VANECSQYCFIPIASPDKVENRWCGDGVLVV